MKSASAQLHRSTVRGPLLPFEHSPEYLFLRGEAVLFRDSPLLEVRLQVFQLLLGGADLPTAAAFKNKRDVDAREHGPLVENRWITCGRIVGLWSAHG